MIATFEQEQPRWRNGDDQPDSNKLIVRFELTQALVAGSSATAKLVAWGIDLNDPEPRIPRLLVKNIPITVHSEMGNYAAPVGIRGRAIFCRDSKRFEVVELNTYAMITGALKTAMTSGDASHTIDGVSVMQGVDPRDDPESATEEVTVYNVHSWDGDDDARAVAVWNQTQSRWELIQVTCPA